MTEARFASSCRSTWLAAPAKLSLVQVSPLHVPGIAKLVDESALFDWTRRPLPCGRQRSSDPAFTLIEPAVLEDAGSETWPELALTLTRRSDTVALERSR